VVKFSTRLQNQIILVGALQLLFLSSNLLYAATDSRYALVIGNNNYKYASKLKNPINDSYDVAQSLKKLSFNTTLIQNATKPQMRKAVTIFLSNLKKTNGVGLFYYAGHGVQFSGSNYLVPIETKVGTETQIMDQSFDIKYLLNGMSKIETATNIIILDACRDNPFKNTQKLGTRSVNSGKSRSLVRVVVPKLNSGLSKLDAPSNTFIAFSTAPGKIALDGNGRNSPYTAKFVESLQHTGLTIGEVFREVRAKVVKQSGGKQIPWESSSLINEFYFKHRTFIPMGF
jgi:uncharacterized caspase-like protein